MASKIDICNLALGLISASEISRLDEDTKSARLCRRFIVPATRETLRKAYWRCARGRASLTRLAETPDFGWAYAYAKPADFIRAVSFNTIEAIPRGAKNFAVEGDAILSNADHAHLVYVRDLTTEHGDAGYAKMDDLLTKCVYIELAIKLCWSFQQSSSLRQSLYEELRLEIAEAKSKNAFDGRDPLESRIQDSDWVTTGRSVGTAG